MTDSALLRFASTLALLLSSGCVPDFGVDLSAIREPKLLAIASNPAEAKGEETTTLTALVAVPPGATAPPVSWSVCLARKPLTELGPVSPACLEPGSATDRIELGAGDSVLAKLPEDTCRLFGPRRPMQTADGPVGRPVDPDITGGFYQPVVATFEGAPSLGAVRIDCDPANLNRDDALRYRAEYRRNENPRIAKVSYRIGSESTEHDLPLDDAPVQVRTGSELTLRTSWDDCPSESSCGDGYCTANEDKTTCAEDCGTEPRGCGGAERYVWYNRETLAIEPRREGITVAWFTSSGTFGSEQTGLAEEEVEAGGVTSTQNRWVVGEQTGPASIWLVIRDSRGGQSWQTLHVDVAP